MENRHPLATLLKAKLLESEKRDLNLTIMRIQNYLECIPFEVAVEVAVECPIEIPIEIPIEAPIEIPIDIPIHPEYKANTEKVIESFRARDIHLEARATGFVVIRALV